MNEGGFFLGVDGDWGGGKFFGGNCWIVTDSAVFGVGHEAFGSENAGQGKNFWHEGRGTNKNVKISFAGLNFFDDFVVYNNDFFGCGFQMGEINVTDFARGERGDYMGFNFAVKLRKRSVLDQVNGFG